jgi:WD40 repeat protein
VLAASSVGGEVTIWGLDDREPIRPPLRLPHYVLGLGFSPDGAQLAIPFGFNNPDEGDGVEILDVRSGERVARLPAESDVRVVAFSPDGRLLATSQIDGTARLWATDGWQQVGSPLPVGEALVSWVAFSPDARTLAVSSDNGEVGLWDVESRSIISPLPGQNEGWSTTRFSPDGRYLFAAYDNGRAVRWEVAPSIWQQRACAIAGGLTPSEWEEIVPDQDYIQVCPE